MSLQSKVSILYVDAYYVLCYNLYESAFIETLSLNNSKFRYAASHATSETISKTLPDGYQRELIIRDSCRASLKRGLKANLKKVHQHESALRSQSYLSPYLEEEVKTRIEYMPNPNNQQFQQPK
jgi:hypothetical protein